MRTHRAYLITERDEQFNHYGIVGRSKAIQEVVRTAKLVAQSRSTVLLTGEVPDAKAKAGGVLRKADAYTERTQKGAKTYYRARFAGFDRDEAEAACKQLKRSDLACMALKI